MFIDSIVGSSWKAADSSGDAPMMSPAATVTVFSWPWRASARCVARYSTPPTSLVTSTALPVTGSIRWSTVIRPDEPAGGSRLPWKSLKDRIWMSSVGPLFFASAVPLTAVTLARAHRPTDTAPTKRRLRELDIFLLGHAIRWGFRTAR